MDTPLPSYLPWRRRHASIPDRELLIDPRNNDSAEGERLATYLATLSAERLTTISASGGDASVGAVAARSFTPSTTGPT
ncbi:hypothetical protein [Amycolatopsis anabasis]|uniref:hypothetical protein n=1 Tax=Amycolatopsis anabasis TaxID=1840409 RepID=UPI00131C615D|nr:hypothetical protein [Amycolatopsis anabasis]